jgi:O-methyltransferase involved in polyketide biosynthesis
MEQGEPSQTAVASAIQRALHRLWDAPPHVLDDPFAYPFVGGIADAASAGAAAALAGEVGAIVRASFVVRHRFAEDELEKRLTRQIRPASDQPETVGAIHDS